MPLLLRHLSKKATGRANSRRARRYTVHLIVACDTMSALLAVHIMSSISNWLRYVLSDTEQRASSTGVAVQVPISREDFEAAVQPLLRRIWAVMQRAGDAVFLEWADRWWLQPSVCSTACTGSVLAHTAGRM